MRFKQVFGSLRRPGTHAKRRVVALFSEFGKNPAGPLLLLENPAFLRYHVVRLMQILRQEALPDWFVASLTAHPAARARREGGA